MNKLPTKQIYLLFIIIVGIITLSVYSTYALFTYENETSDIVSIHIPKSLTISENIYEYQQISIEPDTVATTDIDIHNAFEYEVCYSVWYKIIGELEVQSNVQVFELIKDTLTSSGTIKPGNHIRVQLVIVNDNETAIKVNLGTIGANKTDGSCSMNISSDKSVVATSYKNIDILTKKLIEETKEEDKIENYITYKDINDTITYQEDDKIYTSNEFTYEKELFTLKESEHITIEELIEKNRLSDKNIYFCKEEETCSILYQIKLENIEVEKIEPTNQNEEEKNIYHIKKYNKLLGFSSGKNGLRKINEKDYIYYGDSPNNYIYYNCENNDDLNTCELWRIVGFFYNKETKEYNTKIVRNESIGKYQFDYQMENNQNISTNTWIESTLHKYLNEEFKLKNNYDIYLDEYIYEAERIPNLEADIKNMKIKDSKIDSKINLLNLSDYLYASSCEKEKINEYKNECFINNWLNNIEILNEWSLTSKEIEIIKPQEELNNPNTDNEEIIENNENIIDEEIEINNESTETVETVSRVINYVYTIGSNITEQDVNSESDVRPVVYLKPRILLLDGNGSFEKPYIVK